MRLFFWPMDSAHSNLVVMLIAISLLATVGCNSTAHSIGPQIAKAGPHGGSEGEQASEPCSHWFLYHVRRFNGGIAR